MLLAFLLVGLVPALRSSELTIRVVGADGVPVGNAQVTFTTEAATTRLWRMHQPVTEVGAWEEARAKLGVSKTTDARGELVVDRPPGAFNVCASAGDGWSECWVFDDKDEIVELKLERERAFAVRVIDEHAATRRSIAVVLFSRPTDAAARGSGFVAWQAIVETDANGIARFPHAQRWLVAQPGMEQFVALAIPVATPVERAIDAAKLGDGDVLELTIPPVGIVEIAAPGVQRGVARLRTAPASEARAAGMGSSYAPLRARIEAGLARFAQVGLGAELELEVTWDGLAQPVRERFAGPTRVDQTVRHVLPGKETLPVLVGRLLDEEQRPIANRNVAYMLEIGSPGSSSSRGWALSTDEHGRFRLMAELETLNAGQYRQLMFHSDNDAEAGVDLTQRFEAGEHELGDVVLATAGSDVHLRRLSDDELVAKHATIRRNLARSFAYERELETCLLEMVRRGGERWREFMQRELDAHKARDGETLNDINELVWLTALRRIERAGDPLMIEIEGDAQLETTLPALPTLRVRVVNVDTEMHVVDTSWPDQFRIECKSRDGGMVAVPESDDSRNGFSTSQQLAPGQWEVRAVPLATHLRSPPPGEYELRVLFHPCEPIGFAHDARGWITTSSRPLMLRVKAAEH